MPELTEKQYRSLCDYVSGLSEMVDSNLPDWRTYIEAARRYHFEKLAEEEASGVSEGRYRSFLFWFLKFMKSHPVMEVVGCEEAATTITARVRHYLGNAGEFWADFEEDGNFDDDDAYSEIIATWDKISPVFGRLRWAVACAKKDPFISEHHGVKPGSAYAQILDIAGHLQKHKGPGKEILLPTPKLGSFIGKHHTTIGYHRARAQRAGILKLVRRSRGKGNASGYLCTLPDEAVTASMIAEVDKKPSTSTDPLAA